MNARRLIRRLIRAFGFELRRFTPHNAHAAAMYRLIRSLGVDLVIDVGANEGQFGVELRDLGYQGRILSIEPLRAAHAMLRKSARGDARWTVLPRCAVGDHVGEVVINVARNSVSSSILPMLAAHEREVPDSRYAATESVPLVTLDSVCDGAFGASRSPLLKVDTQGYEWQVLDGAGATLARVVALQLELALVPLYENQRLWRDYVERVESCGFSLYYAYPAFTRPDCGQTLQWDAMFVRNERLP